MDLHWMGRLARNRILCLIIAVVAMCGVVFRIVGLGRSIWLDEAWVANSVTAGSLASMFSYDSWLQTSPPLFLLLVRITVSRLGLTPSVFRLIPLLFGLISVVCMFILTRRVLSPRYALPAWTLFVLSPVAIEYSKTLKQYSLELAATTAVLLTCILYLQRPTARRFWLLLAIVAVSLLMAYPVAFILPGITLVVCLVANQLGSSVTAPATFKWGGLVRGFILAAVAGAILIGLYLLFVLPNTSPSLRSYFANGSHGFAGAAISGGCSLLSLFPVPVPGSVLEHKKLVCGGVGLFFFIGFILACLQFRKVPRRWLEVQVICAVPCFLLIICSGFTWYPMTPRTSLFLLPAVTLLFLCNLQLILDFALHQLRLECPEPLLDIVMVGATLLLVLLGVAKQPLAALNAYKIPGTVPPGLNVGEEDVASAVSFLSSSVQRGDLLWVHASCSEAFKLYARMTAWSDVAVQFGHTGWPCCPRGIPVVAGSGKEDDVRSDLNSGVPTSFSGTVWLLYTTRTFYWKFVGVDQTKVMEDVFRERGCLKKPTPAFYNIGVSSFDCRASP